MGSVSIVFSLPARLGHAGDVALVRGLAQADPAEAELAEVAARAPTAPATVVLTRFELGFAGLLYLHRSLSHSQNPPRRLSRRRSLPRPPRRPRPRPLRPRAPASRRRRGSPL